MRDVGEPSALRGDFSPDLSRDAARRQVAARLRAAGLPEPDLDARVLLCAALDLDHAGLIRDPDAPLGGEGGARLTGFVARRLAREPVSRILGRREFWGLDFAVSGAVLDPRPETEGLVEAVLTRLRSARRDAPLRLLDLGVGSGAILAALLAELPRAFGVGVDASPAACRVAAHNLAALGLADRAVVVCGDWDAPLAGRFDVVVSNPPYIASEEMAKLEPEVRDHDPRLALDGGPDGLGPYRRLVPALAGRLTPDGLLAFECGTGQGAPISGLMAAAGFGDVRVMPDLAGHDRVVIGSAPPLRADAGS